MSLFTITVGIGNPAGGDLTEMSAMVDTGAYHTMLPESLMTQLHIRPVIERSIGFADGNRKVMGIGQARIACAGDEMICPVIFGPEDTYLLGATTLEIFSLAADPVNHTLVPVQLQARPI